MKVSELTEYLQNTHCPKDAEVVIYNEDSTSPFYKPEVLWWSDDRKTIYLGSL